MTRSGTYRWLTSALLAASLVFGAGGAAMAQEGEFTLRIGTVAPQGTPWSALLASVKKRIEKESGGRIKVKLYLGGQLGSENSLVRRCQSGSVGGIAVSNGALGSAVPELFSTELPFLFSSYEQADRALDASTPLVRELMADKGFVFYMWGENGFRHFGSKEKFMMTPADLRGQKMRAQPAMPHVEMYRTLGASASTIAVGEVTSALANNVVVGFDNTLLYAFATQWHKEVKYMTLSSHIYQPAIVTWCKSFYDSLPDDLKKVMDAVPEGETKRGRSAVRAMNKLLEKKVAEAGVEVKALSDAQKAAFKAATASVHGKFKAETSAKGRQLLELLQKHL